MSAAPRDIAGDDDQELILDRRHTLVPITVPDPGEPSQPDPGSQRCLLFRSAAPATATEGSAVGVPQLWFDVGGRRLVCELKEAAGFGESAGAAVVLFEVVWASPADGLGEAGASARWGLRLDGEETVGVVPPSFAERLRLRARRGSPGEAVQGP